MRKVSSIQSTTQVESQLTQAADLFTHSGALEKMRIAVLPETKGFVIDAKGNLIPVAQMTTFGILCEGFPEC